jgi:hypothetical protein
MLVQTFVENIRIVPTPYLRNKTLPLVQSLAFELTDGLRLRPTLESERITFYQNEGKDPAKILIPSMDIDTLSCVIEATTVDISPFDSPEIRKTLERVRLVWLALLLYFASGA